VNCVNCLNSCCNKINVQNHSNSNFEILITWKSCLWTLHVVPYANMQTFPPNSGGGSREQGYQTLGTPAGNVIKLNFCMTQSNHMVVSFSC
jgi:hypothetical protein